MKKILFYINALINGGAERVMCNLANEFSKRGYQVIFVTSFSKDDAYSLNKAIRRYNLETDEIERARIKKNIVRTKELIKIMRFEKPNIVVSFLPETNFRAIIASRICKIPCIVSIRSNPAQEYNSKAYYLAQKILYPLARGLVFQTEDAKKWFPKHIQEKSRIIMNQVDSKFYDVKHTDDLYYVSIARLEEQKNYPLLINSFADFLKVHSENRLLIFGKGQMENELQQLIHKLELDDKVKLMGQTNNVPEVLSKAKAFVLSSDFEGMPNALLEAMAVGVPVISTDCPCGGPRTIINHMENGYLVPVNDERALTAALLTIEESGEIREKFKINSRKKAEEFRPEDVFAKWEEYILSLSK